MENHLTIYTSIKPNSIGVECPPSEWKVVSSYPQLGHTKDTQHEGMALGEINHQMVPEHGL